MGCGNERTVEKPEDKNKGYPVCRFTLSLTRAISSMMAFDSKTLILGGNNELLSMDLNTKEITEISKKMKVFPKDAKQKNNRVNSLIKSPEGKIASGQQDGSIKIWDLENKKEICTLEGHTSIVWDLKYMEKDKLISGADDNTSKIWNLKDKKNETLYKSKKQISSVVYLGDNKVILASGKNVFLFNLDTKDQESVLDVPAWYLLKLKNGDVAAGLGNGLLYILQITDEITVKTKFPKGHKKIINLIIELDNNKLVTCSDENDLILWDINDPESIYMIKGHNDLIKGLCHIEGNKFASVSKDNTLKIWE